MTCASVSQVGSLLEQCLHSSLEILTSAHSKYVINSFLPELRKLAFTSQSHYLECKHMLLVVARHELTES